MKNGHRLKNGTCERPLIKTESLLYVLIWFLARGT